MPLYILILAGFGGLTGGFLFFRHAWFADMPLSIKTILLFLALSFAFLPLLMTRRTSEHPTCLERATRHGLYAWYVGGVLCMAFTLVADMVCFTGFLSGIWSGGFCLMPGWYNIELVGLALGITVTGLWSGLKIPRIKQLVITSPKIIHPVKIAVLSDMHLHRTVSVKKVEGIVARVNNAAPDMIVMTGDIIDDAPTAIADLLTPLKQLKAPKWFVTGNHEFYVGYNASLNALQNIGARLLENNGILMDSVFLAGIPDKGAAPFFGIRADVSKAFAKAPVDSFRILLSHTPIDAGTTPSFDLEIAGHTHGGQIFPFHLLARLGNKYLAGLYRNGTSLIYVSRGTGQWGPQMRFLAPAEITLIELRPSQQ